MKSITLLFLTFFLSFNLSQGQDAETRIEGRVVDENQSPISFANIILFNAVDSTMAKAGYSEDDGSFAFPFVMAGSYYLNISFVGYDTYISAPFEISKGETKSMGLLPMIPFTTELGEVVVASTRPVVEVKPDKTVFNVEGSVNAIGYNVLELLRKAPGVVVDNNDRLMLVGKSGVKVYIDGKQSVLTGDDLTQYLKSLQSSQIESIEIITQPSSRFEAEGNAGIINIRLIKDKSLGTNANLNIGHDQAIHGQSYANLSINNRTQNLNVFGSINYGTGENSDHQRFTRITPALVADQQNRGLSEWDNISLRAGVDITTGKNATIGLLGNMYANKSDWASHVTTLISPSPNVPTTEILRASNDVTRDQDNYNLNANYRFDNKKGVVLNFDIDYGSYTSESTSYQPNMYYDAETNQLISTRIFSNIAPTTIDIQTFKADYETPLLGGNVGAGIKLARINTNNDFDFFDIVDGTPILNTDRSNQFEYQENINAGYVNYSRQWEKIGLQLGVRVEETDAEGVLTSETSQNNETVVQDYLEFFPSGGITYQLNPTNSFRIGFSRRIDRPNYQDLNPFEFKLDELTFQKGNPFLRPQFSNSLSLTHTFKYTLNTSLTFSHTNDLMAELTDTSGVDGAAFITTENVAEQDLITLSVSYPFALSKIWNVFANASVMNTHNLADFGDNKIVDISATNFNFYMQHSFMLPKKITLEVSGWYNSPGIWGGNFASGEMWSIDAGIQKKVLKDRGNIKLSISDIFKSQEWSGENNFGALQMTAMGGWESRRAKINFTYLLGNSQVKSTRRRTTGLEDESKRIKSGN